MDFRFITPDIQNEFLAIKFAKTWSAAEIRFGKIILEEEVDHVRKGDIWYKYACDLENLDYDSTYLQIIEEVYPGSTKRKMDLNFEARKQAGFSCDVLKVLSKKNDCKWLN